MCPGKFNKVLTLYPPLCQLLCLLLNKLASHRINGTMEGGYQTFPTIEPFFYAAIQHMSPPLRIKLFHICDRQVVD